MPRDDLAVGFLPTRLRLATIYPCSPLSGGLPRIRGGVQAPELIESELARAISQRRGRTTNRAVSCSIRIETSSFFRQHRRLDFA